MLKHNQDFRISERMPQLPDQRGPKDDLDGRRTAPTHLRAKPSAPLRGPTAKSAHPLAHSFIGRGWLILETICDIRERNASYFVIVSEGLFFNNSGIFTNSGSKCDLDESDLPKISVRAMISLVPSYISSAAFASLCQRDRMISSSRSMLYRFLILYGSLYAGFGLQSPYLPILLDTRHLRPETIALALAAGTAMRLMAAQAVARLAGRLGASEVFP